MHFGSKLTIYRNPAAIETTVGSEVVLMMIASGRCYGLGETGSAVWRHIEQPSTLEDMLVLLKEEYEAPDGTLEQDVKELIEQWAEMNSSLQSEAAAAPTTSPPRACRRWKRMIFTASACCRVSPLEPSCARTILTRLRPATGTRRLRPRAVSKP